jgi:PncC family amidohydrolase
MPFLTPLQADLSREIAVLLTSHGETIAVAESTTGGLISAALLLVPGASRYYRGGGVLYTLDSRVTLAGVPNEMFANYRGTTVEMILAIAESMRRRLGATWCIAESGLAGPTPGRAGQPPGRTVIGIAGPLTRSEVAETGLAEREANMVEFTTRTLRFLRDTLVEAGGG